MTYLCVPIFFSSLDRALSDAERAAELGADVIEFRIDRGPVAHELAALVRRSPLPCIVTCRSANEGGTGKLSDGERIEQLSCAAGSGAAFLDLEYATFEHANPRKARYLEANDVDGTIGNTDPAFFLPFDPREGWVILSSHDFTGRPDKLYTILTELNQSPADIAKLVWTARTVRDNIEAFEILQSRVKPTIAICMGEAGIISRILAKKFGAFLTFASLSKDAGTAPGQVTVADMKGLYRWDAITPQTRVYGVVGSPVGHSMSPAIHNAAFAEIGWDGVYVPLLVNEGYESFKAFAESFFNFAPLHLSGLSVTIPHKENALRWLKERGAEIDPLAEAIGAVNTIVVGSDGATKRRSDGGERSGFGVQGSEADASLATGNSLLATLKGFSTDYAAILDSITGALGIAREGLAGMRVAVLGAGGTGRTAVAALAHYGATVVVYNRTRERADALAAEFNGKTGKVVSAAMDKLCDSCCQIYVNTTSVGMAPNVDASPFGDTPPKLGTEHLVMDAIYNPMETRLIREARAAGAKVIGGVEMFVRQAAGQFEAWTGKPAPVELMREVVERRLS